jgi:acyl carrier protein
MSTDIDTRVQGILVDLFDLTPDEVGPATSTDTVDSWDSLQHLTLVLALEEEFGLHFDDEESLALVSYPLIVTIVTERLG